MSAVLLTPRKSVLATAIDLVLLHLVVAAATRRAPLEMTTTTVVLAEATAHVATTTTAVAPHPATTTSPATVATAVPHPAAHQAVTTRQAHPVAATTMLMAHRLLGLRRTRNRTRMGMELMADRTQPLLGAVALAELHLSMTVEAMTVRVTEPARHLAKLVQASIYPDFTTMHSNRRRNAYIMNSD